MANNGPAGYGLEDLLPHRPPMLIIGGIVEVDAEHAVTRNTVDPAWPMADREGVPSLIAVELAAQTAGICNGWVRIQTQGPASDQTGWLVAVKRAVFYAAHLPFGLELTVRADNTLAFDKFREVSSRVHGDGRLLAEIVLQLYQP
jgi:predicted hotdog family 3-hydroxylacyl-ACP dehydratase